MRHDPLVGKIVQTESSQTVDFYDLVSTLLTNDVIYLAEKHDNPEHHRIQLAIINKLLEQGKKPSIGFEFFSMNDTPLLLNFIDSGKVTHKKADDSVIESLLRKQLGWEDRSDEMWGYYFSLLDLARKEQLQVAGLDLSRSQIRRLTRKGLNKLTRVEKKQLFSTRFMNEPYKEYMFELFANVHCGMKNPAMQSRLYDTWIARNDKIALSITQMYEKNLDEPMVIIIGGGHTEYGLGVVDRVNAILGGISQVTIGLREISIEPAPLEDYLAPLDLKGFEAVSSFDYIWFTQRVSYEDPCE